MSMAVMAAARIRGLLRTVNTSGTMEVVLVGVHISTVTAMVMTTMVTVVPSVNAVKKNPTLTKEKNEHCTLP